MAKDKIRRKYVRRMMREGRRSDGKNSPRERRRRTRRFVCNLRELA